MTVDAARAMDGFQEFARVMLDDWGVPGAALVVVKGGATLICTGLGRCSPDRPTPVTPGTLFGIGSCTKAFTATLLAMLVEGGKLAWDTPIHRYIPWLRLQDPIATARITARDLVTHRSGLPRHQLFWYRAGLDRSELLGRLRYLEPSAAFRERWQYQDMMFVVAGELVAALAEMPWQDALQVRIFDPLGMAGSNASIGALCASPDHAQSCGEMSGDRRVIPFLDLDAMAPSMGINASAEDLGRWLHLQLNGATHLIGGESLAAMHTPQIEVPAGSLGPGSPPAAYGLGWGLRPYREQQMAAHFGRTDGYSSAVSVLPEAGIGVAVLSNLTDSPLPIILSFNAIDRLLGLEPIDWHGHLKTVAAAISGRMGSEVDQASAPPPRPHDAYTGCYAHPAYGEMVVASAAGGLRMRFHGAEYPLRHREGEQFIWEAGGGFPRVPVEFDVEPGRVATLSAHFEPSAAATACVRSDR